MDVRVILPRLSAEQRAFLDRLAGDIGLLADISRADVLVFCPDPTGRAVVTAQARPHSVPPIYDADVVGQTVEPAEYPALFRALASGQPTAGEHTHPAFGAPVILEVFPLQVDSRVIGALSVEKTLIEHERHQRRARAFQQAVRAFQWAVSRGLIKGLNTLSPFGEYDGILVVDTARRIQYASGVANNLYRRLGAMELLPGKRLSNLRASDDTLVARALEEERCLEEETEEGAWLWVKKVIPLYGPTGWRRYLPWESDEPRLIGALLTIHDATAERQKEQMLKLKEAMLQEIQHRVKNSLQTIVSLLRMQARRVQSEETRQVLEESITRLLSVAAVHDFLYNPEGRVVNLRALSERILHETARVVLPPDKQIHLTLEGPDIYLPAQQATPCALIINELLLNALEHGYANQPVGTVSIALRETDKRITVEIHDDGSGLPQDFDINKHGSLGLSIVRSLVEDGLNGQFELRDCDGVMAIVSFPKTHVKRET